MYSRDARAGDQDLDRRHHAEAVGARNQPLADHALDDAGEDETSLVALVLGKGADDARDRFRRVHGVQRAHHQVSGLRGHDGRLDGFEVAHLADQDHVGVLSQGGLQGDCEVDGVVTDLALIDEAQSILVDRTRSDPRW